MESANLKLSVLDQSPLAEGATQVDGLRHNSERYVGSSPETYSMEVFGSLWKSLEVFDGSVIHGSLDTVGIKLNEIQQRYGIDEVIAVTYIKK